MTEEAILACKLLAIDPYEILPRDITQFKTKRGGSPTQQVSEQVILLRYNYYEDKRVLKIKAVENILVKIQTAKHGHLSAEGQ